MILLQGTEGQFFKNWYFQKNTIMVYDNIYNYIQNDILNYTVFANGIDYKHLNDANSFQMSSDFTSLEYANI